MKRYKITSIKKSFEILFRLLLVFWLILIIIWTLLQVEAVQTYLAKKATAYLSEELNTEIKIDRLKLRWIKYLEAEGLLVKDLRSDTLTSISSLQIDLLSLSLSENEVAISAHLEEPYFNMNRLNGDSTFNYQFLIDYFSSDSEKPKEEFTFSSRSISINDGRFSYHDYNKADDSDRMDYDHMDINGLDLKAQEVKVRRGFIDAKVKELRLRTADDFELEGLSTILKIEPELLAFKELKVQTYSTELSADISFTANSFKSYQNFEEEVFISANFKNSLIELADVAYFVPQMTTESNQVLLDGKISGTIANLESEDLELHLNKNAYLIGGFSLRGLPKIEETFIFFDAEELFFNASGLRDLPISSFKENFKLKIPKEVQRFGNVTFKGNFTGYINDFVAYGNFTTALGAFGTDLLLSQEEGKSNYRGALSAKGFNLGNLLAQDDLGQISFDLEVDGKGLTLNEFYADAKGQISSLEYRNYNYQNIELNGEFTADRFKGSLEVNDENLKLSFEGGINGETALLRSNFLLKVDEARLARLNLYNQEDSLTNLSFRANINLLGSQLEELDGNVYFDSIHYSDMGMNYKTDSVYLEAFGLERGRELNFSSSFMDAKLKGQFRLKELGSLIKLDLQRQIPNEDLKVAEISDQDFEYEIDIKQFEPICDIFLPALSVDSGTTLYGTFNNTLNVNTLHLNSPQISYGNYEFKKLMITAGGNMQGVSLSLNSREFYLSEKLKINGFHLGSSLESGKGKLNINWEGMNSKMEEGQIQLSAKVDSFDVMDFSFSDSYFYLNDSLWTVGGNNKLEWRGKDIRIDSISIGTNSQGFTFDGRISEDPNDSLRLSLNNFDLNYLSSFIPAEDLSLKGRINGRAVLRDAYDKRLIISDLKASGLYVNEFEIGGAAFESYWLKDSTGIVVNSYIGPRKDPMIKINGKLNPKENWSKLDMDLRLNHLPMAIAEPFIDDKLSDIQGELSGKVEIGGTTDKPLLDGELQLIEAQCRINYLNTVYKVDHPILIRHDFIGFDLMEIEDENGAKATATGTIFHQNYEKFNLDIGIEMNDFLGLNTSKKDNELFYGTAIVSGQANVSGYADQLIFELYLKARKGTDFKIPIQDDVSVSSNDFLVFTNSPKFNEDSAYSVDLSGIELNFELEIEPEAKTTIILDESIGDIIKARGKGKLNLQINTLGNFDMFGQYELTEGEYLFTLQNIVNKKFLLSPGSKMMWDGDPYQARLDIQAIYNLRASLYSLMPEDSTGRYKRRMPVELILNLGGYLLNPEIAFDIKIPQADELVQSRLQSILYVNQNNVNEQELNQQVFGLLLLGRFMPPSTGANTGTASRGAPGMNNGYELLSNQLSNWLSSVSDEFDVGLSYRPADEISQEELDVSLTTELLNDRLVLDGSFGYISDRQNVSEGNASNFIGEFMIEYKLKRDGKLRIRGFNRSNNYDPLQINSLYTQGVGLFYQEEYDHFSEIWKKYFGSSKAKEEGAN